MTDYLEELLQGSGEVLEEARRRLEELLFPLPSAALLKIRRSGMRLRPRAGGALSPPLIFRRER